MTAAHVRTLLDADAMAGFLRALPVLADGTARLGAVSLERVWAKPNRSFHTLYSIIVETDTGAIRTRAWAALLRSDQSASQVYRAALKTPEHAAPAWCQPSWSVERSTALIDSPRMLVQVFPWDYRLPTLPLALDPQRVGESLTRVELQSCMLAGYWPGVRCQLRYERGDRPGVVYGKLFSRGAAESASRRLEAIERAGQNTPTIATPRACAYLKAFDLLVTGPVEGEPLENLLRAGTGEDLMGRVATGLAAFQGLSVSEINRRFRPADDLGVVQPWAALVGAVFPTLAPELSNAVAVLERQFPGGANPHPVLVHRDFYHKQVLVGPSKIGVLDLDTACQGDGEIDVANFCAHLVLRAMKKGESPLETSREARHEFVETYRALRPATDMRLVEWYMASALLRLGCLYAIRPWWHSLAPRLIEASRRVLGA